MNIFSLSIGDISTLTFSPADFGVAGWVRPRRNLTRRLAQSLFVPIDPEIGTIRRAPLLASLQILLVHHVSAGIDHTPRRFGNLYLG